MEPLAYPDDPFLTAPPYCAPGEIEPPDPPHASEQEAVRRVRDLLIRGRGVAFGEQAGAWRELMLDAFANDLGALFAALLDSECPSSIERMREHARRFVHHYANEQLAEMDQDALEREGFA